MLEFSFDAPPDDFGVSEEFSTANCIAIFKLCVSDESIPIATAYALFSTP